MTPHPVFDPGILTGFHLLEADAGTGKTWTIARLVVRAVIERGLSIDRIAVLTFTKAAAAELNQRIGQLLEHCLSDPTALAGDAFFAKQPGDYIDDAARLALRRARLQLEDAPIATIHSFCQRVLSENALSLGRWDDPELQAEDAGSLRESVANWWRREVINGSPQMAALLGKNGLSFERLNTLLAKAMASPDASIATVAPVQFDTLAERLREAVVELKSVWQAESATLTDWMINSGDLKKNTYNPEKLPEQLEEFDEWLQNCPARIDSPCSAMALLDLRRALATLRVKISPDNAARFNTMHQMTVLNDLLFERAAANAGVAEMIRETVREQTEANQRRDRLITFDGLLDQTLAALQDSTTGAALAASLRSRYPLAFVDEFQDTDPVQWDIFQRIYLPDDEPLVNGAAPDCGLILVGDPKQAIYSFRNADVFTYLAAAGRGAKVHRLGENHRSSRALIDAVNLLHDRQSPFALQNIRFVPAIAGSVADDTATQPPNDGRESLVFVALGDQEAPLSSLSVADLAQQAAAATAAEVSRLLAARSCQAIDIAVLVRTIKQGNKIKQALGRAGIGAVEISRDSVFASEDARDLHRIVAAIANPSNNGLVRGALATTLLGYSLAQLEADAADSSRWQYLLQVFTQAQQRWFEYGPQASVRHLVLVELKLAAPLARSAAGERRLTNLLHLLDMLADESLAAQGPGQASAWLGRQIRETRTTPRGAEQAQLRLESDETLVRILTVFGSKGLEFPVVFLPFSSWPTGAGNDAVVTVHENGRRIIAPLKGATWPAAYNKLVPTDTVKERYATERFHEDLRLNYVALTRAVRRCYYFWSTPAGSRSPVPSVAGAYMLDRDATGPDGGVAGQVTAPDAARILDTISRLAAENPSITQWHWLQLLSNDSARTTHSAAGGQAIVESAAVIPVNPVNPDSQRGVTLARSDKRLALAWATRSFTTIARSLTSPGDDVALGPDHDQSVASALIEAPAPGVTNATHATHATHRAESMQIASTFVRGANAGTCLHEILEHTDFESDVSVALVGSVLQRYGLRDEDPARVAQWLTGVLASRLPVPGGNGFCLADVGRQDTIREMSYMLSVADMDLSALVQCVRAHYPLSASISGPRWAGFLNGFIDLVVRVDGRYWLADFKSNWLAEDVSQYTLMNLEVAMAEHAYSLQMCLYSLALHRMLRKRVSDYQYETHFGGVHYLFLRGMRGDESGSGVFAARPPAAMIDQLDRIAGTASGNG